MRYAQVFACLFLATLAFGATPLVVDLGVADPATPRTYAVAPGELDFKLTNARPKTSYEIVGESRQKTTPELPGSNALPACSEASLHKLLDDHVAKRTADAPEAEKAAVKLNETDVKAVLETDLGCGTAPAAKHAADKAKLAEDSAKYEKDKAKYDADQKTFDDGTAKPAAEKTRLETEKAKLAAEKTRLDAEKKRIDEVDAGIAKLQELRDSLSVTFEGYTIKAGETLQKTFKVAGEDTTWTVVVTTQGGSAAVTAKAAAKAADPIAANSPNLDRLLATTASHMDKIVGTCKYTDNDCNAKVYINADQISALTITDIPTGAVSVRVTAGEFFPCSSIGYNIANYAKAPSKLILPLHMKKGFLGIGSVSVAKAEVEAAAIYGLDWCPQTGEVFQKTRMLVPDESRKDYVGEILTREGAESEKELAGPDPRLSPKAPPIASLPLFLRGRAKVVTVEFAWADGSEKLFEFDVVYQRFWLEAGGFFAFSRRSDQSIDTETIAGTPELQKVRAIRRDVSIEPSTGIVLNIHPGNYPILAFQFGIAANSGRSPSYFGGLAVRAREIGKRGLATLGVGVALQQELQFPNLQFGETYPSTSPLLKATPKYGLTFPYISLSLGFSFGGVAERTNVADGVE
jgi:hypothetical protein